MISTIGRILSETPLIKGLKKFPPSKWHQLGVQLNVPPSTLKTFEYNYMHAGGVERCLTETLVWWYNKNTSASWNQICAALHTVNEEVLAKEVARNHGKPNTHALLRSCYPACVYVQA